MPGTKGKKDKRRQRKIMQEKVMKKEICLCHFK